MSDSSPFFSVCIPLYNTGQYIAGCIESVLDQSFQDYEVIIIDDGSVDDGGAIADRFAERYRQITVVHQDNAGIFHSRIRAFEMARGQYVISLDADDYLQNEALSIIHRMISRHNADVVIYNNYIEYENGTITENEAVFPNETVWQKNKNELFRLFFSTYKLSAVWRKAIKRDLLCLEPLKDYPRISMSDDWIHSYYPLLRARKILYIQDRLVYYRILSSSMTAAFDGEFYNTAKIIYDLKCEAVWRGDVKEYPLNEVKQDYVIAVSKALIYAPGAVKNDKKYYEMLEKIRGAQELRDIYFEVNKSIGLVFRIPYIFLYKKYDKVLLLLKKLCTRLRKRH